jgi:hypothetical protein
MIDSQNDVPSASDCISQLQIIIMIGSNFIKISTQFSLFFQAHVDGFKPRFNGFTRF